MRVGVGSFRELLTFIEWVGHITPVVVAATPGYSFVWHFNLLRMDGLTLSDTCE